MAGLVGGEPAAPAHLYFHVPFCRERCVYCDYPVISPCTVPASEWLAAVSAEAELRRRSGVSLDDVQTVLVGGGTPSVLGSAIARLAEGPLRDVRGIVEWTVEANPEDLTDDVVAAWTAAGVTRVSLGVQSLRPETLRWLGRRHDREGALRAMDVLARSSLSTWSIDWIFGFPLVADPDPVVGLVAAVQGGGVPHVNLFELTQDGPNAREPGGSPALGLPDSDRVADQYLQALDALEGLGYPPYQLTAFARPGHESIHAEGILRSGSWLGLGPAAHSRLGARRTWNLLDWGGYSRAIAGDELPIERAERPDPAEEEEERLHALLERSAGIPPDALTAAQIQLVTDWVRRGQAVDDGSAVRLTPSGWLLLDRFARELAQAGRGS